MGIIENLPYKCGNLPNHIVTCINSINLTLQKYLRETTPLLIINVLSYLKC